jgi:hypothetical protein
MNMRDIIEDEKVISYVKSVYADNTRYDTIKNIIDNTIDLITKKYKSINLTTTESVYIIKSNKNMKISNLYKEIYDMIQNTLLEYDDHDLLEHRIKIYTVADSVIIRIIK